METEKIIKTYAASDLKVDEGKREVVSVISTDSVDRDGEVVLPRGLKRKNFNGNPVVFWNHDYSQSLPIGKCLWLKEADGKIVAKSYISDKTQLARDVFGLMQDGVLNAFSIGFVPLRASSPMKSEVEARPDWKDAKRLIREFELLEYSVVGMPANPEALTLAVSKGYSQETLSYLRGVEGQKIEKAEQVIKDDTDKRYVFLGALNEALNRYAAKRWH